MIDHVNNLNSENTEDAAKLFLNINSSFISMKSWWVML